VTDIFISYSTQNRRKIAILVGLFERCGWTVWWDQNISSGKQWEPSIEQQLAESRCILVAWSRTSVLSEWVQREARAGLQRNVLVPILLEPVNPPEDFRHVQCARLTAWTGSTEAEELMGLLRTLANVLGTPVPDDVRSIAAGAAQEISRIDAAHAALEYSAALLASRKDRDEAKMERVRHAYEGLSRALAPISDADLHDLLERLLAEFEA
jgi:hypothetical protein